MNTYSLNDILSGEIGLDPKDAAKKIKFDGIRIPIIQRDYAHGRVEEKVVRRRFLDHIFQALTTDRSLELDFVYGSVQQFGGHAQNAKTFFVPLDGQQRLTTLFLLYWYIGNIEISEEKKTEFRSTLSKFSYATRATSSRFCQELCKMSFKNSPSAMIKKSIWFHDSFAQDPTVRSMLKMIEEIETHYLDRKAEMLFARLEQLRFYVLPLDGFNLSDELYIKMNGRGKQLTDFENFKADLVNWMSDKKQLQNTRYLAEVEYEGHKIPLYLKISSKIDNEWTGVFWEDTKNTPKEEERIVDPPFMRFIMRTLLTRYMAKSGLGSKQLEDSLLFSSLMNLDRFKYQGLTMFEPLFDEICQIEYLEIILDRYSRSYTQINQLITPSWDQKTSWKMTDESINLRQYVLFYAVLAYLEHNDFETQHFSHWIRVVWNIIVDPELRRNSTMINYIKIIDRLAIGSSNIIQYLNADVFKSDYREELQQKSSYYTPQIYEEHIKALLIAKSDEFLPAIRLAESHILLKGKIFFLLADHEGLSVEAFCQRRDTAVKILTLPALKQAYRWLRASMALNAPLDHCIEKRSLSLANDNLDNWREILSNELQTGIAELIRKAADVNDLVAYVKSLNSAYQLDPSNLWLYNLIHFEQDDMSLLDYSESVKIAKYLFWDDKSEHNNKIYLFNKTNWTDSNILLSNFRNQVISSLWKSGLVNIDWEYCNIHGAYFRGKIVECVRTLGAFTFIYRFELNTLKLGLRGQNLADTQPSAEVADQFREKDWIFRKKYHFANIRTAQEVDAFWENVEYDFFDANNPLGGLYTLNRLIGEGAISLSSSIIEPV